MAQATITYKLSAALAPAMRQTLAARGWTFDSKPYMEWQGKGDLGVVSFYSSGSVVLQSKQADILTEILDLGDVTPKSDTRTKDAAAAGTNAPPSTSKSSKAPNAAQRLETYEQWRKSFGEPLVDAWIGIDEAGKGDFFGPLITAAVRVQAKDLPWLAELGVGDSKTINDSNVKQLASQLKKALPYSIVKLMPETYNRLYEKFGNLNRLLAWSHAASSEEVLEKAPAELIFSDQFTKQEVVPRFFKGPGKDCRYVQQTKAESDAAVGAASILARAEFLWSMDQLAQTYGMTMNKGAGTPTIADARRFVSRHGVEELNNAAKTHFKTMETIGAR